MLEKEELQGAPGNFGHILKEIRQKNGYTREQVAERAGISTRYLSAIENEQREPSYDVLYRLFHSLGISADTIFYQTKIRQTTLMQSRLNACIWNAQIVIGALLKIFSTQCLTIKNRE